MSADPLPPGYDPNPVKPVPDPAQLVLSKTDISKGYYGQKVDPRPNTDYTIGPAATGATAGTPGAFTPAGATPPPDLAATTGVVANPATAWTTGQYVTLGDASSAHWSSTAWVAGVA